MLKPPDSYIVSDKLGKAAHRLDEKFNRELVCYLGRRSEKHSSCFLVYFLDTPMLPRHTCMSLTEYWMWSSAGLKPLHSTAMDIDWGPSPRNVDMLTSLLPRKTLRNTLFLLLGYAALLPRHSHASQTHLHVSHGVLDVEQSGVEAPAVEG